MCEEGYIHPSGANGHPELIHDLVIFSGFGTQAIDCERARFSYRGPVFCKFALVPDGTR